MVGGSVLLFLSYLFWPTWSSLIFLLVSKFIFIGAMWPGYLRRTGRREYSRQDETGPESTQEKGVTQRAQCEATESSGGIQLNELLIQSQFLS